MSWEDYWEEEKTGRQGPVGDDGTTADTGYWVLGATYYENHRCGHTKSGHGQSVYRAKVYHIASVATEPEVGALWNDYWVLFSEGGQDGAGSGDVVGPTSATPDNLMAFYDTGGKRAKDSGVSKWDVLFGGLAVFTGVIDRSVDSMKMLDHSTQTYYRIRLSQIHRATETISLMSKGLHPRSTYLPCKVLTYKDLPVTRRALKVLPFEKDVVSYAECSFVMPDAWDGEALSVQFYGSLATAGSGTVRMAIGARCVTDGESQDAADCALVGVTMQSPEAAYYLMISDPVSLTPAAYVSTSRRGGCKILLTVCRYGTYADTVDEDFLLEDVYITYGVKDL